MRIGVALSAGPAPRAPVARRARSPRPRCTSRRSSCRASCSAKQLDQVLVTPPGGGKGRPLLVFLHGYGGTPGGHARPGVRRGAARGSATGRRSSCCPRAHGWWHDRDEGRWGSYVLRRGDSRRPGAQRRRPDRVAIGGISMGGFGALDLGRLAPERFCAVGGHSPAVFERGSDDFAFGFDNAADFASHDLLTLAREALALRRAGLDRRRRPGRPSARRPRRWPASSRPTAPTSASTSGPAATTGTYWDAHFAQYLQFYADACS